MWNRQRQAAQAREILKEAEDDALIAPAPLFKAAPTG
jgi:hypothetical protein